MRELVVPAGTATQKLVNTQITPIDNGFILNRMYLISEAGRPPVQVGRTEYQPTWEKVIEELKSEG